VSFRGCRKPTIFFELHCIAAIQNPQILGILAILARPSLSDPTISSHSGAACTAASLPPRTPNLSRPNPPAAEPCRELEVAHCRRNNQTLPKGRQTDLTTHPAFG
jgi:hypothetical protein